MLGGVNGSPFVRSWIMKRFSMNAPCVMRSNTLWAGARGEVCNQRKQTAFIVRLPLRAQLRAPRC